MLVNLPFTRRGLVSSGDQFIGQILSQTPEDPDDTWPGLQARQILEHSRSRDIEQGLHLAWPGHGGQPERALADKYQEFARRTGTERTRTRRMLQRIAENWDRRAWQEDQLPAVREDF